MALVYFHCKSLGANTRISLGKGLYLLIEFLDAAVVDIIYNTIFECLLSFNHDSSMKFGDNSWAESGLKYSHKRPAKHSAKAKFC